MAKENSTSKYDNSLSPEEKKKYASIYQNRLKKHVDDRKKNDEKYKRRRKQMIILDIVAVLLILLGAFLLYRHITNAKFIEATQSGDYEAEKEERLTRLNFPEGYVPYYNLGNMYYKDEKYDEAIASYKKALNQWVPKKKECSIRVNLALAMIKKIDFESLKSSKDVDAAIMQLQAARNILTAKGCAEPAKDSWNGHSKKAEQLKKEIDQMIDQLEQAKENSGDSNDDQNNDQNQDSQDNKDKGSSESQNDKQPTQREKDLQDELEERQQEAGKEQQDAQDKANQKEQEASEQESGENGSDGEGGSDFDGKTW